MNTINKRIDKLERTRQELTVLITRDGQRFEHNGRDYTRTEVEAMIEPLIIRIRTATRRQDDEQRDD